MAQNSDKRHLILRKILGRTPGQPLLLLVSSGESFVDHTIYKNAAPVEIRLPLASFLRTPVVRSTYELPTMKCFQKIYLILKQQHMGGFGRFKVP